jgi:2-polyprenyl-6-methoxyphenol hydroxylase-like FAD-dependent oxidoreductase
VSVAVVEQATFPRDTLSSHLFEADALAFLDRLGVTDRLRATGAPFCDRADLRFDDIRFPDAEWPQQPGDVGGMTSIRRLLLDPILAEAAAEAGAEVRMATKAVGLVQEGERVAGIRVAAEDGERELHARLVVGADGRGSTVAELCGARKYNVVPSERALYWAFFEGASPVAERTFVSHRWADRFILGIQSDGGLYQVLVWPEFADVDRFKGDLEGLFIDQATSCEPIAAAISGARRVGKIFGAVRWAGFFREASGPGWVLAGDAGHFKDPAPGRGIGDAFLQAETLAPAIAEGLEGDLDARLARWGRWRDDEFAEHYWLAVDLGKTGPVPAVLPEVFKRLHERGNVELFLDLLNHRSKPSEVLTPPRLVGATARVLRKRTGRLANLREVGGLLKEDLQRRWLNRRPAYS